jgi:hypothetical protein
MSALTGLDLAILMMERQRFRHPGAKDEAITVQLGLTPLAYAQHLNRLIDQPEALVYDPVLVNRLRRLRRTRQAARRPA